MKLHTSLLASAVALAAGTVSADPWNGPYAGAIYGSFEEGSSFVGGVLGYNMNIASGLMFGAELESFTVVSGGFSDETWLNLRAGYVATPQLLVYGTYGLGGFSDGLQLGDIAKAAVGVEFAVTDNVTVRGEVGRQNLNISPIMDGPTLFRLGAFWHF